MRNDGDITRETTLDFSPFKHGNEIMNGSLSRQLRAVQRGLKIGFRSLRIGPATVRASKRALSKVARMAKAASTQI